ncbi:hypothetical protein PtB15_1B171 [Puccinia triticina]|nr:hypothetical protein PtB15_1B171 [Puccinia triticina]
MRRAASHVPPHSPAQPAQTTQPIIIDEVDNSRPSAASRAPRPKQPRRTTSQTIARTPRVHPAGQPNQPPSLSPSHIIAGSGAQPGAAIQSPGPVITPSRIIDSRSGTGTAATRAQIQVPSMTGTQTPAPVITPSRIIHSGSSTGAPTRLSRAPIVTPIHHPPPDPMSEDERRDDDPPHGSSSEDDTSLVYGSMDGFIRPPPPRGLPSNMIPSEDRELRPAALQTGSPPIQPAPQTAAAYGDEPPQAELSALLEREAALSL